MSVGRFGELLWLQVCDSFHGGGAFMLFLSLPEVSAAPSAGIVPPPDRLSFSCTDILFWLLIDGAE